MDKAARVELCCKIIVHLVNVAERQRKRFCILQTVKANFVAKGQQKGFSSQLE